MSGATILRRRLLAMSRAFLIGASLIGVVACGNNPSVAVGARGGIGGLAGRGGAGAGGASGEAPSGAGGCGAGGAADHTGGAGEGGAQTVAEIDQALLDAPTTGGLDVPRAPPMSSYPACQ
jgi:hypothetical protein